MSKYIKKAKSILNGDGYHHQSLMDTFSGLIKENDEQQKLLKDIFQEVIKGGSITPETFDRLTGQVKEDV